MTRTHDETGLTVIELLVAMFLMGIASVILYGFLDSTTAVTARATRHVSAEDDARFAFRTVTQELRAANPMLSAYPSGSPSCVAGSYPTGYQNCVTFEVQRPTEAGEDCPYSVITYGLKDNKLREDRRDFDSSCTVSRDYTGRVVLDNVVNGGAPVFTFYDAAGNEVTGTTSADISKYTLANSIKVSLTVEYQNDAPPITLSSVLALRNNR